MNRSFYDAGVTAPQLYRLLACFVLGMLVHLANTPWWLLAAVAVLIFWRLRIEQASVPLPSLITRALLAVFLFLGVMAEFGTVAGRDSGTMLMIGLVGIKFLELRTTRDYMIISFVLYFMTLIALLFDQSIPVFLLVLVVMALITVNLVDYHSVRQKQVWLPTRRLLRLTGFMLLQALPLALVLFVFFPRLQGRFGFNLGLAKSGLSQNMEPGTLSGLIFDDEMAFRVEFPPDAERPPLQSLYWRAFVLWDVDARLNRWTSGRMSPYPEYRLVGGRLLKQKVTLPPTGEHWLFALDVPTNQPPPEPDWLGTLRSGAVYQASRPVNRKIQYTITSQFGAKLFPLRDDLPDDVRRAALRLRAPGELDPRVVKLARQLKKQGGDAAGIVRAVMTFFRTEDFQYTSTPGTYGDNMLGKFLFDRRLGYCEHFASSAAILLRLADVPARLVVGYQGGEYNPYGDFFLVRQANAHVWVEAYVPEDGWVRIDPTVVVSPARIAGGVERIRREAGQGISVEVAGRPIEINYRQWQPEWVEAMLNEGDLRWQQVEEVWDQWILSYNPESQEDLLGQNGMRRQLRFLVFAVAGVLVTGLTLWGVWWWLRRPERQISPEQKLWAEYQDLLAAAGVPRQPWEGPLDYAARVAEMLPAISAPVQDFAEAHARQRYAPPSGRNPAALERMRVALAEARAALEKSASHEPA